MAVYNYKSYVKYIHTLQYIEYVSVMKCDYK